MAGRTSGAIGWQSPSHALWALIASGTLTVMAGAVLGPVVNQVGTSLGVSQSLAGLVITTHGLFIVLTSPVAGAFGVRAVFATAAVGAGAALVGVAWRVVFR